MHVIYREDPKSSGPEKSGPKAGEAQVKRNNTGSPGPTGRNSLNPHAGKGGKLATSGTLRNLPRSQRLSPSGQEREREK